MSEIINNIGNPICWSYVIVYASFNGNVEIQIGTFNQISVRNVNWISWRMTFMRNVTVNKKAERQTSKKKRQRNVKFFQRQIWRSTSKNFVDA